MSHRPAYGLSRRHDGTPPDQRPRQMRTGRRIVARQTCRVLSSLTATGHALGRQARIRHPATRTLLFFCLPLLAWDIARFCYSPAAHVPVESPLRSNSSNQPMAILMRASYGNSQPSATLCRLALSCLLRRLRDGLHLGRHRRRPLVAEQGGKAAATRRSATVRSVRLRADRHHSKNGRVCRQAGQAEKEAGRREIGRRTSKPSKTRWCESC